jgi:hypothetical protein
MAATTRARELKDAVAAGDEGAAKVALTRLIEASSGGWDTKMEAHKACRAEHFEVDGDVVRFRIERHPGQSHLTHRVQLWEVDTSTGRAGCREVLERITEAQVLDSARKQRDGKADTFGAAAAAYEYGSELGRERYVVDAVDVARGWVMLSLPAVGRWRGRIDDMRAVILEAGSGFDIDDGARDEAREINARARTLWSKCVKARLLEEEKTKKKK